MEPRPTPPLAVFLLLVALLLVAVRAAAPEPAYAAPEPVYLALGDSLAFGSGADDPAAKGYVGLVASALRTADRYEDSGLTLINLGDPGATSADLVQPGGQLDQALEEIRRRADDSVSGNEVEIISIDIGGNDLLTLAGPGSTCLTAPAEEPCLRRLGDLLRDLQSNLRSVLEALREEAPEAAIYAIDLYNPYSGTGTAIEAIADIGIQQLNGVIRAVASDSELGVRLASVFQLFQGRAGQWIAPDGIHPNNTGHAVMAEVLMATIEDRETDIPEEILSQSPAPVTGGFGLNSEEDSGDGIPLLLLLIAVPVSFLAGMLFVGGYFLARGR